MDLLLLSLTLLLGAAALMLLAPSMVLCVQAMAAWPTPDDDDASDSAHVCRRPTLAVLVPAHNEAMGMASALESMMSQLAPGDRVLVVADNCTDHTADVALTAGAEVIERFDKMRRGKGYALDHGVRYLQENPPEVVVIVDADCAMQPGSLDRLARECAHHSRPVQALYLMHAPSPASLKMHVAEFAWRVKNHARPLGSRRLGLACQLMGTGMAFPWRLIQSASLANGHLVEDMQLGLELALAGAAPRFCPKALVTSSFPSQAEDAEVQRTRWEHGHLGVIVSQGPRLLVKALVKRNIELLALGLDLCVPPLVSLLLLQVTGVLVTTAYALATGIAGPLVITTLSLGLLLLALALMWWRFGRSVLSGRELLSIPSYVVAKLPIYLKFLRRRQVEWIRTRRDDGSK